MDTLEVLVDALTPLLERAGVYRSGQRFWWRVRGFIWEIRWSERGLTASVDGAPSEVLWGRRITVPAFRLAWHEPDFLERLERFLQEPPCPGGAPHG